ncbi:hypothetical protein LAZ67_X002712 [Cordylochernes scorpioides]|uniref:Uncharacterized protein n=1 Tax=Cordylochernes scorpioides TaxID=51811 RepID=A0ABY6LTK7_9ARAC|nr:hypothetical protein LAZ67_X002712 [Cordylochernes scorpioides]
MFTRQKPVSTPPVSDWWLETAEPAAYDPSPDSRGTTTDLVNQIVTVFTKVVQQQQSAVVKTTSGDLSLPNFNGASEDWTLFKAEFDRTTMEFNMSNSQNIIRLRKALKGKAKALVHHLLPYVVNAPTIMLALEERFGQPRFMIENLMKKGKDCLQISSQKPETVISFNISVKALMSSVMSLGQPKYLDSIELMDTFVKKLPPDMKENWYSWVMATNKPETLIEFPDWLNIKSKIAMRWVEATLLKADNDEKNLRPKRGPGAVKVATVDGQETKNKPCPACNESHFLEKCLKFERLDEDEKWKVIKSTRPGLCTNCLKQ